MTDNQQTFATIPPVIASYVGYLRVRSGSAPNIVIEAGRAHVGASNGPKALLVTFEYRGMEWMLLTTELSDGEHCTRFCQGELAIVVTALLSQDPSALPMSQPVVTKEVITKEVRTADDAV